MSYRVIQKNKKKVGCKKQKHDFDLYKSSFSKQKYGFFVKRIDKKHI
jgi:hypothetical protein